MARSWPSILFLLCAAVAGAPAPGVQAVLARAKAAQGGAAWDRVASMRTVGTLSTSGLQGSLETLEDVLHGSSVTRYDLKVIRGGSGFDGKVAWSQDDTGDARAEGGAVALQGAANGAYLTTRAYWYPERWPGETLDAGVRTEGGRTFQVLGITPKGGHFFELWVDPATWLFDRIREEREGRTTTTFFGDYRVVEGVKVPFSVRSTSGEAAYDNDIRATTLTLNVPLETGAFAMPSRPAEDSGIAGQGASTTVPLEFMLDHLFVQVSLEGAGPFRFFLDTGGVNVITPRVAKVLGAKVEGALQGGGVGEQSESFGLAKVGRVGIGQAWMDNQTFFVVPSLEGLVRKMGIAVDGVIGYELFRRFVAAVDYDRKQLTLHRPGDWSYKGTGTVVPFVFHDHVPQVEGSIDGIKGKFDLDTGSGAVLDLFTPFVETNGLASRYPASILRTRLGGVGGEITSRDVRAREFTIGGQTLRAPVVSLATSRKGAFASTEAAGNVGEGFFQRFNLVFDYSRQRIILERNAASGKPFPYTRAGLGLSCAPGGWLLEDVVAASPAGEAGLRKGDLLVWLEGKGPSDCTLEELTTLLHEAPAGARLQLDVLSGGVERKVTLVLRDLL